MRPIALMSLCLLAACQTPAIFRGDPAVAVARLDQVSGCAEVTRLTTTIGISGNIGREQALQLARNQTLAEAGAAGADTVVFLSGGPEDPRALLVEAVAYRC